MRLRAPWAAAAIVAVGLVLSGCGRSATPAPAPTAAVNNPATPQNAIPNRCVYAAANVATCVDADVIYSVLDDHVWYTAGPLEGVDIVSKPNGDGTYTITWTKSVPKLVIVGATDADWQSNPQGELDPLFQSPYKTKPGQTHFALHYNGPGLSGWDQLQPTTTS